MKLSKNITPIEAPKDYEVVNGCTIEDVSTSTHTNIIPQKKIGTDTKESRIISSNTFIKQFKNEVWLVKDIIPSTELGEIFGASGSRKTFIALDIGTCVHNGLEWHNHKTTKGNVLYICGEGVNGVRKRLSALQNHYAVNEAMKILPTSIDMMNDDSMKQLKEDMNALNMEFSFIIIDTLNGNFTGNEDSADDFAKMKKMLQKYFCNDTRMIIWIHHTGHQEGMRARGTSARYAGIDVSIKIGKDEKLSTFENTKQKDAEEFEELTFEFKNIKTDFVDSEGNDLYSIVPILVKNRSKQKPLKKVAYHDDIIRGIRLAIKAGKSEEPTKEFKEKFSLIGNDNRVITLENARDYAYKEFSNKNQYQAFKRWFESAKSYNICLFYDNYLMLYSDAKYNKV